MFYKLYYYIMADLILVTRRVRYLCASIMYRKMMLACKLIDRGFWSHRWTKYHCLWVEYRKAIVIITIMHCGVLSWGSAQTLLNIVAVWCLGSVHPATFRDETFVGKISIQVLNVGRLIHGWFSQPPIFENISGHTVAWWYRSTYFEFLALKYSQNILVKFNKYLKLRYHSIGKFMMIS